jgi:outer membrane protein assembly factor BamB
LQGTRKGQGRRSIDLHLASRVRGGDRFRGGVWRPDHRHQDGRDRRHYAIAPPLAQRIGSGVLLGDHAYIVNEPGIACIEARTGKEVWAKPVPGGAWSSIVHADGKLYLVSQKGVTYVLAAKPDFSIIAENALDGATTRASLVPGAGELLIRTYKHLWCIGAK